MDINVGLFSPMAAECNGTAEATRTLAFGLAKQGVHVHLYAPVLDRWKIPHIPTLHLHSLKSVRLKSDPEVNMSIPFYKYFNYKEFSNLDICHSTSVETVSMLGMTAGKFNHIPKIVTHHSPYTYYLEENFGFIGKLLKNAGVADLESFFYNRYDLITTPTISKKRLIRSWGMHEPIVVISNGIDNKFFKKVDPSSLIEKYHLQGKKLLVYCSRMSAEKNIQTVVRRFVNINKTIPESHLVLVGSGPEVKPTEKLIADLHMTEHVTQTGFVDFNELLQWYKAADVTCIWSFVEAQGLVILEAMAQGTPTVGTNANGIMDTIVNGKTGYLANNLDEFEQKIIYLLQNDEIRNEMGRNAREIVDHHRIENVSKNWIKIYQKLIDLYPLRGEAAYKQVYNKIWESFARKNPGIDY
jgi:1,2-diacylglycerol 3-alpha-glucosyltransferase